MDRIAKIINALVGAKFLKLDNGAPDKNVIIGTLVIDSKPDMVMTVTRCMKEWEVVLNISMARGEHTRWLHKDVCPNSLQMEAFMHLSSTIRLNASDDRDAEGNKMTTDILEYLS